MSKSNDRFIEALLPVLLLEKVLPPPRVLPDGRAVRVEPQLFGNVLLTISDSAEDVCWRDGW